MNALAILLTGAIGGPLQGEVISLPVVQGQCQAILDTADPSDQYLVLIGSLAPWNRPCRIKLRTKPTIEAPCIPEEIKESAAGTKIKLAERARSLARAREEGGPDQFVPLPEPPRRKTFHLFIGGRDLAKSDQYRAVPASLHSFNGSCQVYVDAGERASTERDATAAEILRCFEKEILPWADKHLGKPDDVDRDGRFTVFLTSRINEMRAGQEGLDGFVRGSDFFLDLQAPFSNRCDMMVLNSRLKPGPYLRTLVAHEYTHAVTFCGHCLRRYPGAGPKEDEESWLSESIAHLVEELHGFSRSNLDHRVRAYLNAPEAYPLVIPDTFGADLWRSDGVRGGGFLFLRHVHSCHESALLLQLAQSNLRGKENLEVATQTPFAELFRRFGIDLVNRSCALAAEKTDVDGTGLKAHPLALNGQQSEIHLPGTAFVLFHLHGPSLPRCRLDIQADKDVPLQVTLFRLPRQRAFLEVKALHEKNRLEEARRSPIPTFRQKQDQFGGN